MQHSDLVGKPWKRDGMSLEAGGLNCWGLVKTVSARMGNEIPDFEHFVDLGAPAIEGQLQEGIEKFRGRFVRVEEPQAGDVVAFSPAGEGLITHVGIMIDPRHFLHSKEGVGVRISRTRSILWKGIVEGFYRWTKSPTT